MPAEPKGQGVKTVRSVSRKKPLPIRLVGGEHVVPQFATNFSVSAINDEEWVLTIATFAPPPALGDQDFEGVEYAPAFITGRYILTKKRTALLVSLLTQVLNDQLKQHPIQPKQIAGAE